jgi:hypothetical protein
MNVRQLVIGAAGALALCSLAAAVEASPIGNLSGVAKAAAHASPAEKAAHRRCWRRGGALRCRWRGSYPTFRQASRPAPRLMLGTAF